MNEPAADIPLSLATVEDMVAELERRGLAVAVVISHVQGRAFQPGPDIPPEDCERVYGDSFIPLPAQRAAFLCHGIQLCLTKALYAGAGPLCVELSKRVVGIKADLEKLLPKK